MPRASYGSSVIDGEIQYFSASSLTTGDPDSADGCLRKWYYEKVEGKKPPSTTAQELGTQIHAEIESYLRTGVNALGPLAARGKPMLPDPGPDLMIEHDIMVAPGAAPADATLDDAPLRILGIPVVGYIDLLHGRCTNKGVADIEDTQDPPGTIEIIDWKSTARSEYIKAPDVMAKTIQMTVYGKWVITAFPETAHVRLSHGYFVTKGSAAPRKVTLRLLPEQINRQWERVERVAGSIVDAARKTNADEVPANTRACGAYGGCPHRSYCRASTQEALVAFFGPTGAEHMIRRLNNVTSTSVNIRKTLFGIKAPPAPGDEELQTEILRIGREEMEAKYPGLPAVWDELEACRVGHPQYADDLASFDATLRGQVGTVSATPGVGKLATFGPFSDPKELPGLLLEVKEFMQGVFSEEEYSADAGRVIAHAADTGQAIVAREDGSPRIVISIPAAELPPPVALEPEVVELLPPDAPLPEVTAPAQPEVPTKRGRGRPRKIVAATDITPPVIYDISTGETVASFTKVEMPDINIPPVDGPIYFYVNCSPSRPFENFWPMVHELLEDLNKAAGTALDFRLVPQDHKFAYGKWKAAIAAALHACELPPGHYVLDGVGGEIGMAVVEAMRLVVAARGGVFIQ